MRGAVTISRYVRGALGRPFCLGRDDCATWANGLIQDLSGFDLLADCPETTDETAKVMGIHLGRSARKNGWSACNPTDAPLGAVGVFRCEAGHVAAVADGSGWFLCRAGRGVMRIQAEKMVMAWTR